MNLNYVWQFKTSCAFILLRAQWRKMKVSRLRVNFPCPFNRQVTHTQNAIYESCLRSHI